MSASTDALPQPSTRSPRGLDWLYCLLADVQTGMGPYVATCPTTQGWKEGQIGWTLTVGGLAGMIAACAVMFHFANAAMLPMLGEMLAKGRAVKQVPALLSACLIVTQVVVMLLATPAGWGAERRGRKPALLLAFAVLPVRGVRHTLTTHPTLLIAVQVLDGIGAALFGVVAVVIIADLTQGTGRFDLAQSVVGTAVGVGASTSNAVAGWVVQRAGFNAGFLCLAGIAAVATAMFWLLMPETRDVSGREASIVPGGPALTPA